MPLELMCDYRVRALPWHDLVAMTRTEIAKEHLLSAPWLAASVALACRGDLVLALPFSFVFFLTGLRQVHNAHHYALGISRGATEWVMFALSVLMLSSMHAIQVTHLHHHKHCMDAEDVEARSARMPGLRALLFGPVFPVLIHRKALALAGPRRRRWIWYELAAMALWAYAVLFVYRVQFLEYHIAAMTAGQSLAAFFAVWTVHHGCDGDRVIARTLRSRVKSLIVFDMFFHAEHHLFPQVPTCHLSRLAARLDVIAPEIGRLQVY